MGVHVFQLGVIVRQIISMQVTMGLVIQLYTNVLAKTSWDSIVYICEDALRK